MSTPKVNENYTPSIDLLEYETVIGIDTRNRAESVKYVREGIPTNHVVQLQKAFDISIDLIGKAVGISSKTINRRKTGKLKKDQSERVLRLAHLFDRANEVFGDKQYVKTWFKTPIEALGGETPLDYADTEPGAQEIEDLLGRLEHGVFS